MKFFSDLPSQKLFDEFDENRSKIYNSIPNIIREVKKINEDKGNKQSNLFEANENLINNFKFLPSSPWKQKELLTEEFKSLGFYISDHPLNEYDEIIFFNFL